MTSTSSASFSSASSALLAMLAGEAKVTLVSERTGTRYTFKISKADPKPAASFSAYSASPSAVTGQPAPRAWFVSLLSGPSNESDFTYLGMISEGFGNQGPSFRLTRKSRMASDAPPVKAISWTLQALYLTGQIPQGLQVWHEGCCCRCGRTLTVPESIATGLGPECAKKAHAV